MEADISLSNLKNASLGKKFTKSCSIDELLLPSYSSIILPEWTCEQLKLYEEHQLPEPDVQKFTSSWLCGREICNKYYVHDTHVKTTFLGDDLKPDFMVSNELAFPYGEYYISFFLEVKSGQVHPRTNENIGQAAAYCIRLLELSSPQRRHACCLVTNLYEAAVVRVDRGSHGDWIYRKAILDARKAIARMFHASWAEHGNIGRESPIRINDLEIHLKRYLGSGASGIVYETDQKYAVKFFKDESTNLKSKEKHIIDILNSKKPADSDVMLQEVVNGDDEIFWPALLLKPVGAALSPKSCCTFRREDSFFSILETLKHAHKHGIIHNDIRPENIVVVEGNKWLLIDWAAAWEPKLDEDTKQLDEDSKREYYGSVSFASDSVLTQLAVCHGSVEEDDRYKYVIDAPSILSDLISLFRTMFVFTYRISHIELDELMNFRAKEDFLSIIDWWKTHLPEAARNAETKLQEAFYTNPQSIHEIAASLGLELFAERI